LQFDSSKARHLASALILLLNNGHVPKKRSDTIRNAVRKESGGEGRRALTWE
jgi:hypothetical protein